MAVSAAQVPETEMVTEALQSTPVENQEIETELLTESETYQVETQSQTETENPLDNRTSTIEKSEAPYKLAAEQVGKTYVSEQTGREQVNFNREWKFIRNDIPGAESVDYDDSQWVDIGIPHNFSIPYEMQASFYVGYG